jgi:hypothetical protein
MSRESPKWYDPNADNPPWIKALAEVRLLAPREGWCYQHVQAIIVSIDQYAEAALGDREYFLNRPYGHRWAERQHPLRNYSVNVRFAAHCGLNSDIELGPKTCT